MKITFVRFKENFEKRFQEYSILDLGEDSVRYDFFDSIISNCNLKSHQIQLEFPIPLDLYNSNPNPNSKRPENPQLDLYISTEEIKLIAEFAIFKRNSNINGPINSSEKLFKMFNDFLRLGNSLTLFKGEAYFVCVADSKILGAKLRNSIYEPFPAQSYNLLPADLELLTQLYKSSSKIDNRFLSKSKELGVNIKAELIFNERILGPTDMQKTRASQDNILETRVVVYKVSISSDF